MHFIFYNKDKINLWRYFVELCWNVIRRNYTKYA